MSTNNTPMSDAIKLCSLRAVVFLLFLLPLISANAKTATYVIMGKYQQGSQWICPDPDSTLCARVRWMSNDRLHLVVETVESPGSSFRMYEVWLNEPWPDSTEEVQGADLKYSQVIPIQPE